MLRVTHLFAGPVRRLHSPRRPGDAPVQWRSAILKAPVVGGAQVDVTGLAGDAQHDRRHHGGPSKALLCYAGTHYAAWRALMGPHVAAHRETLASLVPEFDASQIGPGGFGENLTLDGVDETTVCLGDRWQVGPEVVLTITEPRGPCGTLARRWMRPTLVREVHATARAGWYVAVSHPGTIAAGDTGVLLDRPAPDWPMARVYRLIEARGPRAALEALLAHEWLVPPLRARLERRLTVAE